MKIPVVIARKDDDSRFGLIKQFTPVYTPEKFHEIDWAPTAPGCALVADLYAQKVSELLRRAGLDLI